MDETREAEELVGLWQDLQTAQVEGDTRRLASLRVLAEANARRPGASGEWALLAREAGRHLGGVRAEVEAQPTPTVGSAPAEAPRAEVPGAPPGPAEEDEEAQSGGLKLGPLIWVIVVIGYLLLQLLGNVGEG